MSDLEEILRRIEVARVSLMKYGSADQLVNEISKEIQKLTTLHDVKAADRAYRDRLEPVSKAVNHKLLDMAAYVSWATARLPPDFGNEKPAVRSGDSIKEITASEVMDFIIEKLFKETLGFDDHRHGYKWIEESIGYHDEVRIYTVSVGLILLGAKMKDQGMGNDEAARVLSDLLEDSVLRIYYRYNLDIASIRERVLSYFKMTPVGEYDQRGMLAMALAVRVGKPRPDIDLTTVDESVLEDAIVLGMETYERVQKIISAVVEDDVILPE